VAAGVAVAVAAAGAVLVVPSAQGVGTVRSAVSLSAPASGVFGSTIRLTGKVSRAGTSTGLSGATVVLQRSVHGQGRYGNLTSGRAAGGGTFAFSVKQTSAFDYRVFYPGSGTFARAFSPSRYPVVSQAVALTSIATTNADTGALRVTGTVRPVPPNGTKVFLQRFSTDAQVWVGVATGSTSSGSVTISANRPGSRANYRLLVAGRSVFASGASPSRTFDHFVWRGFLTKALKSFRTTGQGPALDLIASDPTASVVISSSGTNGDAVTLFPNTSGCTKSRVTLKNNGPSPSAVDFVLAAGERTDAAHVEAPLGAPLSLDIAGATDLHLGMASLAPLTVVARFQLLCAN